MSILLILFVWSACENCFSFQYNSCNNLLLDPRRFSPFSLRDDFLSVKTRNTLLVEDESNFHACVDARVLKSRNDVIVSAWPEFHLPALAFPRTSSWHAVDDYCQFNEAHTVPPAFWLAQNCRAQNEVDFRGFRNGFGSRLPFAPIF